MDPFAPLDPFTASSVHGSLNFPSDKLKCSFEIGGWYIGGGYQGIYLKDNVEDERGQSGPGWEIAANNPLRYTGAQSSYTEQSFEKVETSIKQIMCVG